MDEHGDEFEPDTFMRLAICDWVNAMAERAHTHGSDAFNTPAQFIAAAECLEHFITNGGTVEFNCTDNLRKTVRGQ